MAKWTPPEISPWRRRGLKIPPDSFREWVRLAAWEIWMGILLYGALHFGIQLMVTARQSPVALNIVLNFWCGWLLMLFAAWLLWELWSAVAPKPITDDFLKLLEDSFARDWRKPRTWPWTRVAWAYGFALVGVTSGVGMSLLMAALSASPPARAPTVLVETSQQFRVIQ